MVKKNRLAVTKKNEVIRLWNAEQPFGKTWRVLERQLEYMYQQCKASKADHNNSDWPEWSGAFNRHCRGMVKEGEPSPYRFLFGMWSIRNQLLTLHRSMVPRTAKKKVLNIQYNTLKEGFRVACEGCLDVYEDTGFQVGNITDRLT